MDWEAGVEKSKVVEERIGEEGQRVGSGNSMQEEKEVVTKTLGPFVGRPGRRLTRWPRPSL